VGKNKNIKANRVKLQIAKKLTINAHLSLLVGGLWFSWFNLSKSWKIKLKRVSFSDQKELKEDLS
jgi:hypothetical protein